MLQGNFNVVLPRSVCLPCLKTCSFIFVYFDGESAQRLFRSCPVLERITLASCHTVNGAEVFDISVPTLKRLIVRESGSKYQLVLNVPNLLYFGFGGPAANAILGLESLKSVVDARIFCEPDPSTRDAVVGDLVCSLSHVQQLYLDCNVMEAFLCSGQSLPKFNNLTRMRFGPISCLASRLLSQILDNLPRLEFLSFEGCGDEHVEADESRYLLLENAPASLSLRLKEVEFRFFTGFDNDCKLIKYFLKYAKNLKVMKIQTTLSWNEQFEISSPACQIVFTSDELDEIWNAYFF